MGIIKNKINAFVICKDSLILGIGYVALSSKRRKNRKNTIQKMWKIELNSNPAWKACKLKFLGLQLFSKEDKFIGNLFSD